jgi:purine nucleosidase
MKAVKDKMNIGCLKVLCVFLLLLLMGGNTFSQKQKVWIDADTGNETDDIYAIFRLLAEPTIEVVGVSSAHFNNADLVAFKKWNQYYTKEIHTVEISQQLNESLLAVMGKLSIAHPLGADRQMGRAWGGKEARPSAASTGIMEAVKKISKTEKLLIVNFGALTNIASSISLDTSIAQKIVCYVLGAKYNVKEGYWNKSEFNIRNDVNAFDYLLDNPSVDLVIMPIDIAFPFRFERDFLYKTLRNDVPLEKMLKQRWEETNPQDSIRTLWDLALAEAFINPNMAIISEVPAPPEIFSKINVSVLKDDFMESLKTFHEK